MTIIPTSRGAGVLAGLIGVGEGVIALGVAYSLVRSGQPSGFFSLKPENLSKVLKVVDHRRFKAREPP